VQSRSQLVQLVLVLVVQPLQNAFQISNPSAPPPHTRTSVVVNFDLGGTVSET